MRTAKETLDHQFLEMRWRCLSLAADLDRIERAADGANVLESDPRLQALREAVNAFGISGGNRAEHVQRIFSDRSPPPIRHVVR